MSLDAYTIERAALGEENARSAFYNRYRDLVYAAIRPMAVHGHLADDWSQDAWIRIFGGLRKFQGRSALSTWLHRIAVNAARTGRRKYLRNTQREVRLSNAAQLNHPCGHAMSSMDVADSIQQLAPRMRYVLILHDMAGYNHAEIATIMGTSAGTSKSQLSKARKKVRAILACEPR